MRTVCTVIVTYNRKELLRNLLSHLWSQTYPISCVLIIDNNSTDGTDKMLLEHGYVSELRQGEVLRKSVKEGTFMYLKNKENTGGSGGFATGIKIAANLPYDCIWAMDDDVAPDPKCLENMMAYLDKEAQMVVPCRGDDSYKDHAVQHYDLKRLRYFRINTRKRGRVLFSDITKPYVTVEDVAFEGPLMTRELVSQIGIPNKDYFILFDDTDYAHRASQVTQIRYVRNAYLKKMILPQTRGKGRWSWKSYYNLRNSVYFERKYGENWLVRNISPLLCFIDQTLRAILKGNFYRVKWLVRAYRDGIRGRMGKTYAPSEISSTSGN